MSACWPFVIPLPAPLEGPQPQILLDQDGNALMFGEFVLVWMV